MNKSNATHQRPARPVMNVISKLHLGISPLVLLALCVVSSLYSAGLSAAELTSVVNRNQVGPNETFMLLVSINEQVDSSDLDLTPLTTNFEVLGISPNSSSSVSISGGQTIRESTTAWRISLLPKRSGELMIPALRLLGASSQPIKITVSDSPSNVNSGLPLTAELVIDQQSVLPQQQLLVRVTLSAATNVSNFSGPPLTIPGVEVTQLDQVTSQSINNGIARQIIELSFAIFAEKPGSFTIPTLTYSGSEGGGSSIFSNRGRQVIARTTPQTFEVKPKPANAPSPWLVSENVEISSEWVDISGEFRVGEPITRRVTVHAAGQKAEAIPVLMSQESTEDIQTYLDQPQLETSITAAGLTGKRVESAAIMPLRAGQIELPALSVSYWNPSTNRLEIAQLAQETITVLPAAIQSVKTISQPLQTTAPNTIPQTSPLSADTQVHQWQLAVLALLTLLIAQSAYLWHYVKRSRPVSPLDTTVFSSNEAEAWESLTSTLKTSNSRHIRSAISRWLLALYQRPIGLNELAKQLSQNGAHALEQLDQSIYQAEGMSDVVMNFTDLKASLATYRANCLAKTKERNRQAYTPNWLAKLIGPSQSQRSQLKALYPTASSDSPNIKL